MNIEHFFIILIFVFLCVNANVVNNSASETFVYYCTDYMNPLDPSLSKIHDYKEMTNIGDIYFMYPCSFYDSSIPVHVFVHGLNESLINWFSDDVSMEDCLKKGNYRAAFVSLDPRGSIERNANILSVQLKSILEYFVKRNGTMEGVVMIGHSKGGIDIQGAMYHNRIERFIKYVITLGTPHWASPIATLCYDSGMRVVFSLNESLKQYLLNDGRQHTCRSLLSD